MHTSRTIRRLLVGKVGRELQLQMPGVTVQGGISRMLRCRMMPQRDVMLLVLCFGCCSMHIYLSVFVVMSVSYGCWVFDGLILWLISIFTRLITVCFTTRITSMCTIYTARLVTQQRTKFSCVPTVISSSTRASDPSSKCRNQLLSHFKFLTAALGLYL